VTRNGSSSGAAGEYRSPSTSSSGISLAVYHTEDDADRGGLAYSALPSSASSSSSSSSSSSLSSSNSSASPFAACAPIAGVSATAWPQCCALIASLIAYYALAAPLLRCGRICDSRFGRPISRMRIFQTRLVFLRVFFNARFDSADSLTHTFLSLMSWHRIRVSFISCFLTSSSDWLGDGCAGVPDAMRLLAAPITIVGLFLILGDAGMTSQVCVRACYGA
jgi:hypothetical protein